MHSVRVDQKKGGVGGLAVPVIKAIRQLPVVGSAEEPSTGLEGAQLIFQALPQLTLHQPAPFIHQVALAAHEPSQPPGADRAGD